MFTCSTRAFTRPRHLDVIIWVHFNISKNGVFFRTSSCTLNFIVSSYSTYGNSVGSPVPYRTTTRIGTWSNKNRVHPMEINERLYYHGTWHYHPMNFEESTNKFPFINFHTTVVFGFTILSFMKSRELPRDPRNCVGRAFLRMRYWLFGLRRAFQITCRQTWFYYHYFSKLSLNFKYFVCFLMATKEKSGCNFLFISISIVLWFDFYLLVFKMWSCKCLIFSWNTMSSVMKKKIRSDVCFWHFFRCF